jgi:hypothetical protein
VSLYITDPEIQTEGNQVVCRIEFVDERDGGLVRAVRMVSRNWHLPVVEEITVSAENARRRAITTADTHLNLDYYLLRADLHLSIWLRRNPTAYKGKIVREFVNGPRRGRPFANGDYLVELAYLYVQALKKSPTRPYDILVSYFRDRDGSGFFIVPETRPKPKPRRDKAQPEKPPPPPPLAARRLQQLVKRCRERGLLTESGQGHAGGKLTLKARREIDKRMAAETWPHSDRPFD